MFRIRPDGPWVPLTAVQWVPGYSQRQRGRLVALTSTKIKERVELYLYCPSVSSWPVVG